MKRIFYTKISLLFLIFILLSAIAFSQTNISGKVFSGDDNKPLKNVTVYSLQLKTGTSTKADGSFSIKVNKGNVIKFSSVGYFSKEITVQDFENLTINLNAETKQESEVIVTALGIKKEIKKLGYSVQAISGAELIKAREPNAINGLVGKIAGLDVAINKEMLGTTAVTARGGTITLYVVDGIPVTTDTWNINPDDVETYTVLKGFAASALYGSRAQNGAILITTKRGKKNNKGYTIEVNSTVQVDKGFIALPKTQTVYGGGDNSQYEFGDGKGGGINDGDYDVWGPKFEGQLIRQYDSPIDPITGLRIPTPYISRGPNNLKNFIQAGILNTNNISFSSANDRSNIRMSLTNTYQKGLLPNTKLNIVNFNLNAGFDVTPKLKIEAALNYNRQATPNIPDVQYGPNSVVYSIAIWTGADWNVNDPNIKNYWQPGKEGIQSNFAEYQRYHNPWFMSYEWLRGHYKTDVLGSIGITYKPIKNIETILRTNISTYDLLRNEKMPYSAHPYGREGNRGDYREDRRSNLDNNIDAIGKYNGKFKNLLQIDGLVGFTARNTSYNSSFTSTDYLNVPGLYTFANSVNPILASSYNSKMLVLSGYGALDVSIKNYATVGVTARLDKTTALRKEHNQYFYPAVTLSTVLSDYVKLPGFINFLKFRGNYATVKFSNTTPYIGPSSYPIGYGAPYVTVYGGPAFTISDPAYSVNSVYNNLTGAYAPGNKVDPNVTSGATKTTEVGMDVRVLQNKIGLGATYYTNINGPGIRTSPLSQTSGITGLVTNAVKTKLSGLELSLNIKPFLQKTRGLKWDVNINWSTFKEVYKDLPINFTNYQFEQGDRVDKLFANVVARTPDGQVINNSAGYPVYLPKAQYVGNADVKWSWSAINKFSYKSFSLSFQFDGKVGGLVQDYVLRKSTQGGSNQITVEGAIGAARDYEFHHYKDPGFAGSYIGEGVQVSNGIPIQYDPITGVITNMNALQFTNNTSKAKFIQDYVNSFFSNFEHTSVSKTYAKLREVVLTYSLPTSLLGKKLGISKVDISVVGRNLLYFFPSKFKDIDVDQYSSRDQYGGNKREYNLQTPTTRSVGINLNITF